MRAAIQVSDAWKWYKSGSEDPVFRKLNMTVPCGTLYCLIANSGGGKTSLLSCIVGIRKLNKGTIRVFGEEPGTNDVGVPGKNVGYMPQDVSLRGEFSVLETLRYFGTLNGMLESQVLQKSKFLQDFLELPPLTRKISKLSGGEQRRVSCAVALLHNPKLLILDEPTVGVEPVLRQKIWVYLQQLASIKGTTIVITTHYLTEARNADVIGIIREGRMIAETSPTQLINSTTASSLQDAVLILCKENSQGAPQIGRCETIVADEVIVGASKESRFFPSRLHITESAQRIKAIVRKNFTVLFRNLLLLFIIIWIPVLEVLSASVSFSYSPALLSVGVINRELNGSICPTFAPIQGECELTLLSCAFLAHVSSETLDLRQFEQEQDAEAAIHSGSIWGYMILPSELSSNIYERAVSGADVENIVLNSSQITVKLDETNKQISTAIKVALYDALDDFTSTLLTNCGFDPRQGQSPLQYEAPVFSKDNRDLKEYTSLGTAVTVMFFWPILMVGIRLMEERKSGMLERSIVGGAQTWEIIVAFIISEFFILVPQTGLALAATTFVSGIQILGSVYLAFGLLLFVGCCGASLGFLFGSLCRERIEIPILGMACFFPNFMLSGIFWPVEGMPEYLQSVVNIFPCTLSAEALRSIVSRGWDFSHDHVWPGFVIVAVHIALYFILTILLHKVKSN